MSYELCNAISLDSKNNVIKFKHCSNNEYPKDYYETELFKNADYTYEKKLKELLDCLIQGDITISSINSKTINVVYAYEKAIKEATITSSDKWQNNEKYKLELDELAKKFIGYLELAKELTGKYVLKNKFADTWLSKLGKYNYHYGCWSGYYATDFSNNAKVIDYKTAVLICEKFTNLTMIAYNEI